MSARSAIARSPGSEPLSVPMTPVRAIPRSTETPKDFEEPGDQLGRLMLLEGRLGMRVNLVPPPRHLDMKLGDPINNRHDHDSPR